MRSNKNQNQSIATIQGTSDRRSGKVHFRKKRHPWLTPFTTFICLLCSLCFFVSFNAFNQAHHTFQQTYHKTSYPQTRNTSKVIAERKPLSILLLGTDTGALGRNDKGRTDTMMLATINPSKDSILLTSIPRDTKVNIPGDQQSPDKINNAYTLGGQSLAMSVVHNLLHVPIDYCVTVNMGGLEKMVNAVNGVSVTPPLSFQYGDANVTKGKTTVLKGHQALDYARMRHQDPQGDYGRQKRQRQILQSLVMKGLKISSMPRYKAILGSLNGNIISNIKFNDMLAVRFHYAHCTRHIESTGLSESTDMDNGVSYQVPSQAQLTHTSNTIKKSLNLSTN